MPRELLLLILSMMLVGNVENTCDFTSVTGEILQNVCDWSSWLPWNCTCCGPDVPTQPYAVRQRGICCAKNVDVLVCLADCGYAFADDRQPCNAVCGNKTTNSVCTPEARVTVVPKSTTPHPSTTSTTSTTRPSTVSTSTAPVTTAISLTITRSVTPSSQSTLLRGATETTSACCSGSNSEARTVGIAVGCSLAGLLTIIVIVVVVVVLKKKATNISPTTQ